MPTIAPAGGIHSRRVPGSVAGISGTRARGGSALRIDVRTAQARSMLARFQREIIPIKDWICLQVAERVKTLMESRVERQSVWPPRDGSGNRPRRPTNILRPSAGGMAIGVVHNRDFGRVSIGRTTTTGYTVYVSSGQAHLLEYGVDPHWQRMRRQPRARFQELGELFRTGALNKRSPGTYGLFRHPGHGPKPFVMPSYKSARGWLNRQGKSQMIRRYNQAKNMSRAVGR